MTNVQPIISGMAAAAAYQRNSITAQTVNGRRNGRQRHISITAYFQHNSM
jgi:hypothetical protein